jgi:hypothetical protein
MNNFSITATDSITISGITSQELCSVRLRAPFDITSNVPILVVDSGKIDMFTDSVSMTPDIVLTPIDSSGIVMSSTSVVNVEPFECTTTDFPVIDNIGGSLLVSGSTPTYNLSTNAGQSVVKLSKGAFGRSQVGIVNNGAGTQLECGANPAGAWFTQNDLGAAGSENCFFYTSISA